MYNVYIYIYIIYINTFTVLHALNEDNEKYAEAKERALRAQAIQEILATEVTYLQQLEILAKVGVFCKCKLYCI